MEEENKTEEEKVVSVNVPPIGSASPEEPKEEKKGKKWVLPLIIGLIVLLGAGGIFALYKLSPKDNKPVDNTNETNDNKETETIETEVENLKGNYTITKNSVDNFDLAFLKLENNKKNIIYSPLSIKYALGMLMQGAKGETQKQINEVLGKYKFHKFANNKNMSFANALFIKSTFKSSIKDTYVSNLKKNYNAEVKYDSFKTPDVVNKYVSDKTFNLINNLVSDIKDYDFILLNALAIDMDWVNRIQPDVVEGDEDAMDHWDVYYPHMKYSNSIDSLNMTDYHELSFNSDPIAKQSVEIGAVINNYDIVSILGKDKIKKIVMDDYNAWIAKGAPDACEECAYTDDEDDEGNCEKDTSFDFDKYLKELNSNYKDVSSSTDFEFYIDDNVKVFKKDLKKYGDTTLTYVGIMPTKDNLSTYIQNVSAKDINTLLKSLKSIKLENFKKGVITEISGYIPLFNFDYELNLIKDLNKLGISDVFDKEKADLSNLTTNKSFIEKAQHKATIEFSNEGIKASAVTMEGGRGGGDCGYDYLFIPPVEKIDLTFDKPFIFLILDKSTEEVWFAGAVYEPSKYKSYTDTYYELHPEEAEELDDEAYDDED